MGCKHMGKLKKAFAILVMFFFVMSLTAASASACEEKKCDHKEKYDSKKKCDLKDKYDSKKKCDSKDKYDLKDKYDSKKKCGGFFFFDILSLLFGNIFNCGTCGIF